MLSYSYVAAEITGADAENYKNSGVSAQIKQYLCAPTDSTNAGGGSGYFGTTSDASGASNVAQRDLYACINKLYRFAIAIGTTIGIFFLVIGGYYYIGAEGNQENVDKAKDILVSTITAFVILLGGYILLKAINPDLIEFKQIQPGSLIDLTKFSTSTDFRLPIGTPTNIPGGAYTDASARKYLADNGISVNKPSPTTSLEGVKAGIIQEIVNLKKACNCTVIVTAGTESGHATGTYSHGNGYKVDLGTNTTLDNYIKTNFTAMSTRGDGAKQWKNPATGAIYADETALGTGAHWDVVLQKDSVSQGTGSTTCEASTTYNCSEPGTATACSNYNSAFQQYGSIIPVANGAALLKAIAYHETRCQANKVNSGISFGLMQMKVDTANTFIAKCDSSKSSIDGNYIVNNPNKAICLSAEYLKYLSGICGADVSKILVGYASGQSYCTKQPLSCPTAVKEDLTCYKAFAS